MKYGARRFGEFRYSLSARLLVLTVAFVLLAEVLIFLPSIARYRVNYLEDHLASAYLVTETLRTMPDSDLTPRQETDLLGRVGAEAIALRYPDGEKIMLMTAEPGRVAAAVDLRTTNPLSLIQNALSALIFGGDGLIRVIDAHPEGRGQFEIVLPEAPLTQALRAFGERILALSLVISLVTAVLVYISLHLLMVRPMRYLTGSMTRFRRDPEDPVNRVRPSNRRDEIGVAEGELAAMQSDLAKALHQKTRLAALGIAITKISHDLKNILATAQLVSERLTTSDDPEVRRLAPRLEQTIDRAVNLCVQTLNFSREGPPELELSEVRLAALVADVAATLPAAQGSGVRLRNDLPANLTVEADRNHLYRVLVNLAQNAFEAGAREIRFTASRDDGAVRLDLYDDGPGLPPRAMDNLFQPFSGTVKPGGTGLGLAIARDLVRAHGGDLLLASTTASGTCFEIRLPVRQARPDTPDGD